ncbi:MAG: O-antigen ligase family protein, partial [Dehalococcoidia bacterium]|nr:O-antigen ligase family protein [Dehalococcoidia bacterium]
MLELAVLLTLEGALLAAVVILREPKLLVPCVVLGLPIEYFGTQTLHSLGESGAAGAVRALLNPGKAAMLATIVVGVVRLRHRPQRLFPDSAVLLPVVALLAGVVLGLVWSESLKAPNSVLILPRYVAFVFVAPTLIEDRRDVERIVGAFLLAAMALALLAVAQRLFGVFNWRAILIQSDDYSYRSNATFADPNNLARYFALAMSLAVGMVLATGPRRLTIYLAIPTLVLGAAGIVATASRSGWIMLLACTLIVVLVAPIARYTKLRLVGGAGLALVALVALLLFQGGTDAERVRSLTSGVQVLGQREFLIRAGFQMWKDSPLVGVGSGNYQHALVTSYLHLIPTWARTTLSHTSFVSILAELGVVGAAIFLFVAFRVGLTVVLAYFRTKVVYNRLMTGWLGAGLLGIVFHSQSEGRLLDEPYLWLLLAILVAFETGAAFTARPPAARARARGRVRDAWRYGRVPVPPPPPREPEA